MVDRKLKTDRNLKIKILHIYIEKSCMYIFMKFKFILCLHKNVVITSVNASLTDDTTECRNFVTSSSLSFRSYNRSDWSDCIWTRTPESFVSWASCDESPTCESLRCGDLGPDRWSDWRDVEVSGYHCDETEVSCRDTSSPGGATCRSPWSPCTLSCRTCNSCHCDCLACGPGSAHSACGPSRLSWSPAWSPPGRHQPSSPGAPSPTSPPSPPPPRRPCRRHRSRRC